MAHAEFSNHSDLILSVFAELLKKHLIHTAGCVMSALLKDVVESNSNQIELLK